MKVCPKCTCIGFDKYCIVCGSELTDIPRILCPCGAELTPDKQKFCSHCGRGVEQRAQIDATIEALEQMLRVERGEVGE